MKNLLKIGVLVSSLLLAAAGAASSFNRGKGRYEKSMAKPETILATFHVKDGQEEAFLRADRKTWSTYRQLDAVFEKPHLLMKGTDQSGKLCYFEVFTWKDSEIPDHAPDKIKEVWRELESLCERRSDHRGIEGDEVEIVDEAK
jgi:hypothetical protein